METSMDNRSEHGVGGSRGTPAPPFGGFQGSSVVVVEDREAASVLLKSPRLEILEALREPDSAAGLARRMKLPRQRLGYHLRELEKFGMVAFVEERRKGNCLERVLQAQADFFLIGPRALGELAADKPERMRDRFSWAYLITTLAKALRELSTLRRGADAAGKRLPTLSLQGKVRIGSPQKLEAFRHELTEAVAGVAARFDEEKAEATRSFSFFLGAYPTPKPPSDNSNPSND